MKRIVRDLRVVEFVLPRIGATIDSLKCTAVGLESNGIIVVGAIYERCNGHNVFFHGASDGSKTWATEAFMRAMVRVPFVELGLERMSTVVAESATDTLLFDYHFGFEEECRLKGAAHDGSDSIYLVMWKKECKWLAS